MRRVAPSIVLLVFVLCLGCVSSGEAGNDPTGGGGGGGGTFPGDPTFSAARSSPGPGEVSLGAQLADRQTMLLRVFMPYPSDWSKPFEFRMDLRVSPAGVEPVAIRAGNTWPEGNVSAELNPTGEAGRFEVKFKVDGWKSWTCLFGPPWTSLPADRVMHFGTITVKLKQSGQYPVELSPATVQECFGERSAPAYGGVITIP